MENTTAIDPAGGRADGQGSAVMRRAGLFSVLQEDFATHGRKLSSPGFWALAAHRLGVGIDRCAPPLLRPPLRMLDEVLTSAVDHLWKIRIPRATRVGRRVHLGGEGRMFLHARAIGDDVSIGAGSTLGSLCSTARCADLPLIESGVSLGERTRVMGAITVGRGAVIEADVTLLDSVPAGAIVVSPRRSPVHG